MARRGERTVGPAPGPRAQVIVVGLGAMGAATCLALARRGVPVIGIDRFHPPHTLGSTHGDTRITRLAIGEGPQYVPLVRRSHELWRELERDSGQRLLRVCGGLVLGEGTSEFLGRTVDCARRFGIDHELLDGDELRRRFPMFAAPEGTDAYYEPGSGYVRPELAVAASLAQASRLGARLRFDEPVRAWSASAEGIGVRTDTAQLSAERLVLCPGAWISDLFGADRELFTVYRQLLFWFALRGNFERLERMPVFIWDLGEDAQARAHPRRVVYGFPPIDGPDGGVKVASESYEQPVVPDGAEHFASASEAAEMYRRHVAAALPWVGPEPVRSASCLYTCTTSGDFVIDRHPEHDRVLVVSACSGHGFKHSPAIGEALAELLTGARCELDLGPFVLPRPSYYSP